MTVVAFREGSQGGLSDDGVPARTASNQTSDSWQETFVGGADWTARFTTGYTEAPDATQIHEDVLERWENGGGVEWFGFVLK